MKRHSVFYAVLAASCALFSSCASMQVATDVIKLYPMTCMIDQVKVYEGDKGPANYEHLGTVAVYDQGATRVTPFETTLELAKRAVCESGGNALYLSRHEAPNSLVSANHQIIAQMLLDTGDKTASNEGPASGIKVTKELSDYAEDQYRVAGGESVISGDNIYVSVGYGRLLTRFADGEVTVTRGSIQNGVSYTFGYEHIFRDGKWGFGAFCSNFTSSVDAKRETEVYVVDSTSIIPSRVRRKFDGKETIGLHLAGPSASYSFTDNHLFLSARAGLGLAWQSESFAFSQLVSGKGIDTESGVMNLPASFGFGFQLTGELGYRVTKVMTIGATIGATECGIIYSDTNTRQLSWATFATIAPVLRLTF